MLLVALDYRDGWLLAIRYLRRNMHGCNALAEVAAQMS